MNFLMDFCGSLIQSSQSRQQVAGNLNLKGSAFLINPVVMGAAFPQLMEISIKMTITLWGEVSINCIYYTIFSRVLCLSFCQIPSPYQDSHMQIICGNPL